jgi:hypothetical protein
VVAFETLLGLPRHSKTDLSAMRNTVKALEERVLVAPAKRDDALRVIWHLQKT